MFQLWRDMMGWLRGQSDRGLSSARHWHPARDQVEPRRAPSTITPWNWEAPHAEPPESGAAGDSPDPGSSKRRTPD